MQEPTPVNPRMVFLAVIMLVVVWVGVFIILPAITGKPGVAQQMQSDLEKAPTLPSDR